LDNTITSMETHTLDNQTLRDRGGHNEGPFARISLLDLHRVSKLLPEQKIRVHCENQEYYGMVKVENDVVTLTSDNWVDVSDTTPTGFVRKIFEKVNPKLSARGRSWQCVYVMENDHYISLRKIRDAYGMEMRKYPVVQITANDEVQLSRNLSESEKSDFYRDYQNIFHGTPIILSTSSQYGFLQDRTSIAMANARGDLSFYPSES